MSMSEKEIVSREFLNRTHAAMAKNRVTMTDLAKKLDVSRQHLSEIFSGKHNLSAGLAQRLYDIVAATPSLVEALQDPLKAEIRQERLDWKEFAERQIQAAETAAKILLKNGQNELRAKSISELIDFLTNCEEVDNELIHFLASMPEFWNRGGQNIHSIFLSILNFKIAFFEKKSE